MFAQTTGLQGLLQGLEPSHARFVEGVASQMDSSWHDPLAPVLCTEWFRELATWVSQERKEHRVYPPSGQVFAAMRHTALDQVRVVLLGQDPYHGPGQAEGLSFSVAEGKPLPPSLRNMYAELQQDLGVSAPPSGSLVPWAKQGVLLLNTVLTVREGAAGSHAGKGWERFTREVLRVVWGKQEPVAFILWGKWALERLKEIQQEEPARRHFMHSSVHPSPLSAHRGFFGSRPYSRINDWLLSQGSSPIRWAESVS